LIFSIASLRITSSWGPGCLERSQARGRVLPTAITRADHRELTVQQETHTSKQRKQTQARDWSEEKKVGRSWQKWSTSKSVFLGGKRGHDQVSDHSDTPQTYSKWTGNHWQTIISGRGELLFSFTKHLITCKRNHRSMKIEVQITTQHRKLITRHGTCEGITWYEGKTLKLYSTSRVRMIIIMRIESQTLTTSSHFIRYTMINKQESTDLEIKSNTVFPPESERWLDDTLFLSSFLSDVGIGVFFIEDKARDRGEDVKRVSVSWETKR
jgi:hypothetical protein